MNKKQPAIIVRPARYPCSLKTKRAAEMVQKMLEREMPKIERRAKDELIRIWIYGEYE